MKRMLAALISIIVMIPVISLPANAEYGTEIIMQDVTVDRGTLFVNVDACAREWEGEELARFKALAGGDTSNINAPLTPEQLDNIASMYEFLNITYPQEVTLHQIMFLINKTEYKASSANNMSEIYYRGLIPMFTRKGQSEGSLTEGLKYGTDYKAGTAPDDIAKKISEAIAASAYAKSQFNDGMFGNYYKCEVPAETPGYIVLKASVTDGNQSVNATAACSVSLPTKPTVTKSGETLEFKLPVKAGQTLTYTLTFKTNKTKSVTFIVNTKKGDASSSVSSKAASSAPASVAAAPSETTAPVSGGLSSATLTDEATKITVSGDLVGGKALSIQALSSGEVYDEARSEFGSNIKVYSFNLTYNGQPAELDEEMVVSIPLPAGINSEKIRVYKKNSDGFVDMQASVQNNMIVFNAKTLTTFVLAEMKVSNSIKGIVLVVLLNLAIAAGAVYLYIMIKRKRDAEMQRMKRNRPPQTH